MRKLIIATFTLFVIFPFSKIFSQEEKKWGARFEAGYSYEFTKKGDPTGGLQFYATPTYTVSDKANIGIGAGLKLFSGSGEKEIITGFPVYGTLSYKLSAEKTTPFFEGKIGYAFIHKNYSTQATCLYPEYSGPVDIHSKRRGGIFISPSAGMLFSIKGKQRLSISLAYILDQQNISQYAVQVNKNEKATWTHHLAAVRIGYSF